MYSTAEPSSRRFDELALSMYTYYDEDPFYESLYLIDIDDEGTKGRRDEACVSDALAL